MTEPFVAQLRTRGEVIELSEPGSPAITVRVEMPEVWDTIRIHASPDERVISVKVRALEVLYPAAVAHEDFVMKLHGWDVLDENATLVAAGAVDGSIFLLTHRRRRAIR